MSSNLFRIVIIDDEHERADGWARELEKLPIGGQLHKMGYEGTEIRALDRQEALTILQAAESRRSLMREGQNPFAGQIQCALDEIDVLVVDYDLQEFMKDGQWTTGQQLATLARAFTEVNLIVLVNQFATNSFDLTLVQSATSQADIDVGSDQLPNQSLWDRSTIKDFSPWTWNDGILSGSVRFNQTIEWVRQRLDDKVLATLGFTADTADGSGLIYLPAALWERFLKSPDQTFRKLASDTDFLVIKDRAHIEKFDGPCARVAAAIVCHWLDRWLIPAGEVLIDLPHLAAIYPWLLLDRSDLSCWQRSTDLENGFDAMQPDVRKHQFNPGFPISRPVVWRQAVLSDPKTAEPSGFTYEGFPDLVFCENTSKFAEFEKCSSFESDLQGPDKQRFIIRKTSNDSRAEHAIDDVLYEPSVRLTI